MQNSFGKFHARGDVTFNDNSQTYNDSQIYDATPVDDETRERLRTGVEEVTRRVDMALSRLEPQLAAALRSATDELTTELQAPDAARGRLGTAVARLADVASGAGSVAGIAASVQSLVALLGG